MSQKPELMKVVTNETIDLYPLNRVLVLVISKFSKYHLPSLFLAENDGKTYLIFGAFKHFAGIRIFRPEW